MHSAPLRSSGFVLCPNFHRGKTVFLTLLLLLLLLGTSTADTQTCGSCPTVTHGTCTLCPGGATCTAVTCDTRWANNDGKATNGCEEITCAGGTYKLNTQSCLYCGNVDANGYTCPSGEGKNGKVCDGTSTVDTQTCAVCPTVPQGTCTLCPGGTTCTAVTCDSGSYKTTGLGGACKCQVVDVCRECSNNGPKGYTCSSGFYKSGSTCDGKGFCVTFDVVSLTYIHFLFFYLLPQVMVPPIHRCALFVSITSARQKVTGTRVHLVSINQGPLATVRVSLSLLILFFHFYLRLSFFLSFS